MKIKYVNCICPSCLKKRSQEQIQKEMKILQDIKLITAEKILKFAKDKLNTELSPTRVKAIITHSINLKSLETFYIDLIDHIRIRSAKQIEQELFKNIFTTYFKLENI